MPGGQANAGMTTSVSRSLSLLVYRELRPDAQPILRELRAAIVHRAFPPNVREGGFDPRAFGACQYCRATGAEARSSNHSQVLLDAARICIPGGRALESCLRRAGLPNIAWHMFRHTFSSRLANDGSDIVTVKELLGHAKSIARCAMPVPTRKAVYC